MAPDDPSDEVNPYAPPSTQSEDAKTTATESKGIDLSVDNPFLTIWTLLGPRSGESWIPPPTIMSFRSYFRRNRSGARPRLRAKRR